MRLSIGIGLFAYTLAEIALLVEVGQAVGLGWMLAWTIVSAVAGLWLLRIEGIRGVVRIHRQLQQEVLPTRELIEMALIIGGAMLLVAPGIVSDCIGVLLLFPPTRWGIQALIRKILGIQVVRGAAAVRKPSREVIDVRAERVQD